MAPMAFVRACLRVAQAAGSSFQCGTDRMYKAAPAALGICEFTAPDNENSSWSLRVFNDYDTGFKAHFPVPSPILFRMVFNVIPEWVPGPFPYAGPRFEATTATRSCAHPAFFEPHPM